jgi:hypothetical protein
VKHWLPSTRPVGRAFTQNGHERLAFVAAATRQKIGEKKRGLAARREAGASYFVVQWAAVVVSRHAVAYLVEGHTGRYRYVGSGAVRSVCGLGSRLVAPAVPASASRGIGLGRGHGNGFGSFSLSGNFGSALLAGRKRLGASHWVAVGTSYGLGSWGGGQGLGRRRFRSEKSGT